MRRYPSPKSNKRQTGGINPTTTLELSLTEPRNKDYINHFVKRQRDISAFATSMSDEDRHPNRCEGEADPDQETNDANNQDRFAMCSPETSSKAPASLPEVSNPSHCSPRLSKSCLKLSKPILFPLLPPPQMSGFDFFVKTCKTKLD